MTDPDPLVLDVVTDAINGYYSTTVGWGEAREAAGRVLDDLNVDPDARMSLLRFHSQPADDQTSP